MNENINLYPVIVIYNKKCSDSFSCRNLLELGYIPTIVDNSTADYGNAGFCEEKGIPYISMQGNAGLPKAYNAALDNIMPIDDGNGFVIWMDDDTEIGKDYFDELKESIISYPEADIFVPVVYSIDKPGEIISPMVPSESSDWIYRAISRSELEKLFSNQSCLDKTETDLAINSGMCVRLKIYQDYAYDENLFLDCVDYDFMHSMTQKGIKTYVLRNASLYQHLFFHNKWASKESVKKREKIYNRDCNYYKKKIGAAKHRITFDWYGLFFPIYNKLTMPGFKKIYRHIKRIFTHGCCTDNSSNAPKNYSILPDNDRIISGYMLADIENAERIFLMKSKKTKNLPSPIFSYVQSLQIKRSRKYLKTICGRVLLINESLQYIGIDLLNAMRDNGCTLILLMIDPMSAEYPSIIAAKETLKSFHFDKVYTFDKSDAESNGFEYVNTLYSVPAPVIQDPDIRYDLFYCGNNKEREAVQDRLKTISEENGVSVCLMVAGYDIDGYVPCEEIAEELQHANCIFDITQEGQSGVTLRYYEAVVYNRKLLTNNKHIIDMPFYNDRYMKIYDNIEDIDWEWVKEKEPIDYRYHGEFSPNYADFFG